MYFQGESGAFSEAAIQHNFLTEDPEGLASFEAVYNRLSEDPDATALLPIENAYRGTVTEVWDRLVEHDRLHVWAEVVEPVPLALMAPDGETLETIQRVRSHPQALMQSRGYWALRGWVAEPALDTAGSAREVAEHRWPGVAAIANPAAAQRYGLRILAQPLEDYPDNRTRFWLIAQRRPVWTPRSVIATKATLAIDLAHKPGTLSYVLDIFSRRHINLTKIESRPRPGFPFEFRFWIDVAFRGEDEDELGQALTEVQAETLFYRCLGRYPAFSE